jgi:spermidine synthase
MSRKPLLFAMFFLSGFCGLIYQLVWLRIAFAHFGIITPVLSVVLSVFMLGLSVGAWAGGAWAAAVFRRTWNSPLVLYALIELAIGVGGLAVPSLFGAGENLLLTLGETDSARYLLLSAVVIAIAILPWCLAMGATFPVMMAYIETTDANPSSFSFLYLANVLGAMSGAALTAGVLVEVLGFSGTLTLAVTCNLLIAAASLVLAFRGSRLRALQRASHRSPRAAAPIGIRPPVAYGILFATGFAAMAMEVVWTRAFTPVMRTTIYAFASLLTTYLLATWVGSYAYRLDLARSRTRHVDNLLWALAGAAFIPILTADPRVHARGTLVLASIFPFCALLGYLTPRLIDGLSSGESRRAGIAYATNVAGCILGPLAAGYVLLPRIGVKWSLILLALPFVVSVALRVGDRPRRLRGVVAAALGLVLLGAMGIATTHEDHRFHPGGLVRRDHTATVVAEGEGASKQLLVNGMGITVLTPVTAVMAHLPLAALDHQPISALVICFGMGGTFRSLASWHIRTTAVELVPSVRDVFGYFFPDGPAIARRPDVRIIIDDGRRFLKRTTEKFDVVTLDPPPPVEAAGSSLLYSVDFYDEVKAHLTDGGILQQWYPGGEQKILHAVARSLERSFPHVRVLRSCEGWGYHFLASMKPIQIPAADRFAAKLPATARDDLMSWFPGEDVPGIAAKIIGDELPLDEVLNADPSMRISDDRPYNEYYLLRRTLDRVRLGSVPKVR